jgi:hypothetical protein
VRLPRSDGEQRPVTSHVIDPASLLHPASG